MSIINRHGPCFGITLYRWFNTRAEIWFIPKNYTINEHTHPNEDVELCFIAGRTDFCRRNLYTDKVESAVTTWRSLFTCFSVKHYHSHWFRTATYPLIFINFQTFIGNHTPVSAAVDFKEY